MTAEPTPTLDGRHIVVKGRKWRATDPSIPEPLRRELVKTLMAARRAVHLHGQDPAAQAVARRCVHDAKIALGERGEPWWEPPSVDGSRERIVATTRTLLRARGPSKSICPSEVARVVGQPDWKALMPEVRSVALELADAGVLRITQRGKPVDGETARGPLRYRPDDGLELLD